MSFGAEPQQNGAQHLRRCMNEPQENVSAWLSHKRMCSTLKIGHD